jgi:ribosomal-protein-alanine N-acetyltransferase
MFYVICSNNKIVGCGGVNFKEDQTIGIISWHIIHPDFQGKGAGTQLINHRLSVLLSMVRITKIIVSTS